MAITFQYNSDLIADGLRASDAIREQLAGKLSVPVEEVHLTYRVDYAPDGTTVISDVCTIEVPDGTTQNALDAAINKLNIKEKDKDAEKDKKKKEFYDGLEDKIAELEARIEALKGA